MTGDGIPRRLGSWALAALLVVGVPAGVVAAFPEMVAANRALTLAALAAYELLVLGTGLVGRIFRNLEERWTERASDHLDTVLRRRLSRFRARYLEHLVFRHRDFDVKGLTTLGSYTLELERVFVDLSLVPKAPHQISADPISGLASLPTGGGPQPDELAGPPAGRQQIWSYLRDPSCQRLAILGAPGSGKTTLLKYVTLTLADRHGRRREPHVPGEIPILLFLRDHAEAIRADPKVTLANRVRASLPALGVPEPPNWFEAQLAGGRCLVLLDGLDEVADPETRRLAVEWVDAQMAANGRNAFAVTSRPFGYLANPLISAAVVEVRPFTAGQVQRFVANWYLATQYRSVGKDDEGVRMQAREGANDLLQRLRASSALSALAVNPLLLTMIANVHYFRSVLPGRRVELYDEICEVFLGKRQAARGLVSDLTPGQKQLVLQPLAHHMMEARLHDLPAGAAARVITDPLARVSPGVPPERFLKTVEETSGLLLEGESGADRFAHLTFQEYLAAVHIRERDLADDLFARVDDTWWHETIRLYAAKSDATQIIGACLDNGSVAALTLAAECLDQAREVSPVMRARLVATLAEETESSDPRRRRVLTEVQLALRLRRMLRLDEDTYIDTSLVTNAEYQLFLDEMYEQGRFHQPDHWLSHRYPEDSARSPAVGMRGADALAFCAWLTDREPGEWRYRPPTTKEILEQPGKEVLDTATGRYGCWLLSEPNKAYPFVPPGGATFHGGLVRAQVLDDGIWAVVREPFGRDEWARFGRAANVLSIVVDFGDRQAFFTDREQRERVTRGVRRLEREALHEMYGIVRRMRAVHLPPDLVKVIGGHEPSGISRVIATAVALTVESRLHSEVAALTGRVVQLSPPSVDGVGLAEAAQVALKLLETDDGLDVAAGVELWNRVVVSSLGPNDLPPDLEPPPVLDGRPLSVARRAAAAELGRLVPIVVNRAEPLSSYLQAQVLLWRIRLALLVLLYAALVDPDQGWQREQDLLRIPELYAAFTLLQARASGTVPAVEGVLLVRERVA
jgi:energy-coupling factor transporter ATP-binding protein EcfA2